MRTILASLAAAGVLVAGAFVASAVTTNPASAQTADPADTTVVVVDDDRVGPLEEVLTDLVGDGTLTRAQADAVADAMLIKRDEIRAEREVRREERQANRELIEEFLEDDVIDASELSQLGDDHPFNDPDGPFADAASDGEITRDELRELREQHRGSHRGHGFGGGAPAEDASA
jgi:hypothetical protein